MLDRDFALFKQRTLNHLLGNRAFDIKNVVAMVTYFYPDVATKPIYKSRVLLTIAIELLVVKDHDFAAFFHITTSN
ncbi:unnamed protein product [Sphenostylis stenocarpa]|uniref:Uncharacterized protein n=1 Tax=Sphenostylis stenocarpa TaxID=92480 RepID=A0AA86RZ07_9FABA|nr:unnamed protein product [Sphenostylis stenocarpa]